MYNNHIMLEEEVGCECYSLSVMFHAFPVVRRKNTAVISKTHTTHIIGACGRVGLTTLGGRKEKIAMCNTTQCCKKMWDVHVTHTLLCSMHSQ